MKLAKSLWLNECWLIKTDFTNIYMRYDLLFALKIIARVLMEPSRVSRTYSITLDTLYVDVLFINTFRRGLIVKYHANLFENFALPPRKLILKV